MSNCPPDPFRWKLKKWVNVRLAIVVQCTLYMVGGGGLGPQQSLIRQVITGTLCWGRFENEWKRSRKKLQLSICLQSGAPYTTFTWYQHHFSSSCIVVIIFVFLPSYIFIKGFPPRVNYRNFSTSVDTLVHLGTPGMLIGSFRCWSNRLSHKDLQQISAK